MIVVGLDQMVSASGCADPFHDTEYMPGLFQVIGRLGNHPLAPTIFSTKGETVTQLTHFVEVPSAGTVLLCVKKTGEETHNWTN